MSTEPGGGPRSARRCVAGSGPPPGRSCSRSRNGRRFRPTRAAGGTRRRHRRRRSRRPATAEPRPGACGAAPARAAACRQIRAYRRAPFGRAPCARLLSSPGTPQGARRRTARARGPPPCRPWDETRCRRSTARPRAPARTRGAGTASAAPRRGPIAARTHPRATGRVCRGPPGRPPREVRRAPSGTRGGVGSCSRVGAD